MLRKVIVEESGDSSYLRGEQIDKSRALEVNEIQTKKAKMSLHSIRFCLG